MYLTIAARKFTELASGIASFDSNQKMISITGTIFDPPPVPPAHDKKTMIKRQTNPTMSPLYIGNTSLCLQTLVSKLQRETGNSHYSSVSQSTD